MKKGLIVSALLMGLAGFTAQAQSTASGSSNTGAPNGGATPAQNGSMGNTVSTGKKTSGSMKNASAGSMTSKPGSMNESGSKTSSQKMKSTTKTTKMRSHTSSGR